MASIYVMVPCYRDTETPHTIRDCIQKASGYHDINIGVFWQLSDSDNLITDSLHKYSIRNLFCNHTESLGCCWARHRLSTELYKDEDYVLSIDSHTRFVSNWDRILISLFNKTKGKRVISTYPNAYEPPDTLINSRPFKIQAHAQTPDGLPLLSPIECTGLMNPNYYIAGGFLFGDRYMFKDVPYDPYLYFFGEEVTLSARFYTSGYNIWTPGQVILYHYYVRASSPHHWTDNASGEQVEFRSIAVERAKHIMGLNSDKPNLRELDKYGLGNKRTINDYYNATKIKSLPVGK